jgi:FMN phosphatase YigB (HAD superfamily)
VIFDAYGTLFDVHSVLAAAEQMFSGHGEALSQLIRESEPRAPFLSVFSHLTHQGDLHDEHPVIAARHGNHRPDPAGL